MKPPEIVTFAKGLRERYALSHREANDISVCLLCEFNNVAPKTFAPHEKPVSFNRVHRVCSALDKARSKRNGAPKFPLSKVERETNAFLDSLRAQYASTNSTQERNDQ